MDLLICRLLVQALDGERIGGLPHGSALFYSAFRAVVSSRDSGKGSWVSRNMTDATKLPYQERFQRLAPPTVGMLLTRASVAGAAGK